MILTKVLDSAQKGFENMSNFEGPNIEQPNYGVTSSVPQHIDKVTEEEPTKEKEEVKEEDEEEPKWKKALKSSFSGMSKFEAPTSSAPQYGVVPSDERLKELFSNDERIGSLAEIHSYDFTYKPKAQEELGVDGDKHTGVVAQEIEINPNYKGCVTEENGYKALKVPELTAANTANIGDLARAVEDISLRLSKLEQVIGER